MKFFLTQFVSYLLLVVNYRYVAAGSYVGTAASDFAIVWVNYALVQRIAMSKSGWDRLWLALGGTAGSMVGLYLTGARL